MMMLEMFASLQGICDPVQQNLFYNLSYQNTLWDTFFLFKKK